MKWVTKKSILGISGIYILYFTILIFVDIFCESSWCRVHDSDIFGIIFFVSMPLLPVFLFTLITYRMKIEVFRHWVGFAIWATPLLMFLTYLINGGGNNGLGVEGVIGGAFDALLLIILYGLYCGISLWLIVSKYRQGK